MRATEYQISQCGECAAALEAWITPPAEMWASWTLKQKALYLTLHDEVSTIEGPYCPSIWAAQCLLVADYIDRNHGGDFLSIYFLPLPWHFKVWEFLGRSFYKQAA